MKFAELEQRVDDFGAAQKQERDRQRRLEVRYERLARQEIFENCQKAKEILVGIKAPEILAMIRDEVFTEGSVGEFHLSDRDSSDLSGLATIEYKSDDFDVVDYFYDGRRSYKLHLGTDHLSCAFKCVWSGRKKEGTIQFMKYGEYELTKPDFPEKITEIVKQFGLRGLHRNGYAFSVKKPFSIIPIHFSAVPTETQIGELYAAVYRELSKKGSSPKDMREVAVRILKQFPSNLFMPPTKREATMSELTTWEADIKGKGRVERSLDKATYRFLQGLHC